MSDAQLETSIRERLREALAESLRAIVGPAWRIVVGPTLFLDPAAPENRSNPDVIVGIRADDVPDWRLWEHGPPAVIVELAESNTELGAEAERRLGTYAGSGAEQIARFAPADTRNPLRIWDLMGWAFEERDVVESRARCEPLNCDWVILEDPAHGTVLRADAG